ncbi:hypothetical protein [Cellulomonas sp.]|uniref:hypothetical protein n=1 Tax=Cellulomonas sp. TaxID=40001 RepID=UPI003BADB5AF
MTMFRHRGERAADEGFALVFVIGSMLVLAMLALTALAYSMSSQKFARYDQDFTAAMSAAQSGIDDFIAHLNRDDQYYNVVDCGNTALRAPNVPGNLCGWGSSATVGWQHVEAGSTDPKEAMFHYSYDMTNAISNGTITVTSTGRVNGRYRTVEAAVGKGGSTDYVYYTDFESADPANVQAYTPAEIAAMTNTQKTLCGINGYSSASYYWNGRNNGSCEEITFISGDTLDGAVFTNDSVLASGPTFAGGFQTNNPDCQNATAVQSTWNKCLRKTGASYSSANFSNIRPTYQPPLKLDDNSAAFAGLPGCHYFGATRIIFNSNGTMDVWNKAANGGGMAPVATAAPASAAPNCGTPGALATGTNIPVPDNMVIYVSGDTTGLLRSRCDAAQIGGPTGRELPLGSFTKARAAAKPVASNDSYTYDATMAETSKFCQEGNLYVEGSLKGRVTLASEQSIVATGDLMLAGGFNGPDMLGLVSTNSVEVFHPYMLKVDAQNCPGTSCKWATTTSNAGEVATWPTDYPAPAGTAAVSGQTIMGSIQTLQHSFWVQKYNVGSAQGTLQVLGSIAQRWRGIVGTSGGATGYIKSYKYDTRLKYAAPPYFPKWVNAQWKQTYFGEIKTAPATKK